MPHKEEPTRTIFTDVFDELLKLSPAEEAAKAPGELAAPFESTGPRAGPRQKKASEVSFRDVAANIAGIPISIAGTVAGARLGRMIPIPFASPVLAAIGGLAGDVGAVATERALRESESEETLMEEATRAGAIGLGISAVTGAAGRTIKGIAAVAKASQKARQLNLRAALPALGMGSAVEMSQGLSSGMQNIIDSQLRRGIPAEVGANRIAMADRTRRQLIHADRAKQGQEALKKVTNIDIPQIEAKNYLKLLEDVERGKQTRRALLARRRGKRPPAVSIAPQKVEEFLSPREMQDLLAEHGARISPDKPIEAKFFRALSMDLEESALQPGMLGESARELQDFRAVWKRGSGPAAEAPRSLARGIMKLGPGSEPDEMAKLIISRGTPRQVKTTVEAFRGVDPDAVPAFQAALLDGIVLKSRTKGSSALSQFGVEIDHRALADNLKKHSDLLDAAFGAEKKEIRGQLAVIERLGAKLSDTASALTLPLSQRAAAAGLLKAIFRPARLGSLMADPQARKVLVGVDQQLGKGHTAVLAISKASARVADLLDKRNVVGLFGPLEEETEEENENDLE